MRDPRPFTPSATLSPPPSRFRDALPFLPICARKALYAEEEAARGFALLVGVQRALAAISLVRASSYEYMYQYLDLELEFKRSLSFALHSLSP